MLSMETLALARTYADKIGQSLSGKLTRQIVDSLPKIGDQSVIYLVKKSDLSVEDDVYDEYLYIEGKYEHIGSTATTVIVDGELSDQSENPVQNKVIKASLDKKVNRPSTVEEGVICYNSIGKEIVRGLTSSGISVEIDLNNVPDNNAVKEYVATKIKNKVDSVDGKSLSSNDFTDTYKSNIDNLQSKFGDIDGVTDDISAPADSKYLVTQSGINEALDNKLDKTSIDSTLSDSSTNPVQNKIIKAELDKRLEEPTDNPNNVSVVVYNPSTTETHGYTLDSSALTEGTAGSNKIPTSYSVNQAMTKISKVSTADLVNNAITLSFAHALTSTYIITNDTNKPSITFGVTEDFKDEFIGRKIIINYITSLTPSNILTYSGNGEIKYETEAPTPETAGTLIEATLCKNGTAGTINDFLVYVSYKSI